MSPGYSAARVDYFPMIFLWAQIQTKLLTRANAMHLQVAEHFADYCIVICQKDSRPHGLVFSVCCHEVPVPASHGQALDETNMQATLGLPTEASAK